MNYLEAFDNRHQHPSLDSVRRSYRMLFESQRWSEDEIREYKWSRLRRVYSYARKSVPLYRELYRAFPTDLESWEQFESLPMVSREMASENRLKGESPPAGTVPLEPVRTSGTTGSVVESIQTGSSAQFHTAVSIRQLEWAKINPAGSALMLRALAKPGHHDADALRAGVRMRSWANGLLSLMIETGPGYFIDVSASARHVAEFIFAARPDFILAFPSALAQAAHHVGEFPVRSVRTIGETLHGEWRRAIQHTFKAPIQDLYSCQEIGPIAVTCPDSDVYHTMDEWSHCEVVREDGSPCSPGEEGRVLVTNLHSYVTPFIRYDLGDRAIRGDRCPCGRTLGTLSGISGRSFGFIRMPDGTQRSASPMFYGFNAIPGLVGAQVVQPAINRFEVSIIGDSSVLPMVESCVRDSVGDGAEIQIQLVEELERSAGGKIERFRWTGG